MTTKAGAIVVTLELLLPLLGIRTLYENLGVLLGCGIVGLHNNESWFVTISMSIVTLYSLRKTCKDKWTLVKPLHVLLFGQFEIRIRLAYARYTHKLQASFNGTLLR